MNDTSKTASSANTMTTNCLLAKMVGQTMRKTEQLAAMYHSIHQNNPSFDNGFVDVASQSLTAGITLIKNKLSRYEVSVRSMVISHKTSTDEDYKKLALTMASIVQSIQENLQKLESEALPVYLTDQESCQVGLGYYNFN